MSEARATAGSTERFDTAVLEADPFSLPGPMDRTFGFGGAVKRILALEREVAALRARLEAFPSVGSPVSFALARPSGVDSTEWNPRRKAPCPESAEKSR